MPKQKWINTPLWDSIWILSAIPCGFVTLYAFDYLKIYGFIALIILFWTPHLLSPAFLAWHQPEFRKYMLKNKLKYIWTPIIIVCTCTLVGFLSGVQFFHHINLQLMAILYLTWSSYHMAAQNFGVLSLYRARAGVTSSFQRKLDLLYSHISFFMFLPVVLVITSNGIVGAPTVNMMLPDIDPSIINMIKHSILIIMAILMLTMIAREFSSFNSTSVPRSIYIFGVGLAPVMGFWSPSFSIGMASLSHWVVAIGLALHAMSKDKKMLNSTNSPRRNTAINYLYLLLIAAPYTFIILETSGFESRSMSFTIFDSLTIFLSTLFGFRMGMSYSHYLYDPWVYSFKNEAIRTTIGADILRKSG